MEKQRQNGVESEPGATKKFGSCFNTIEEIQAESVCTWELPQMHRIMNKR